MKLILDRDNIIEGLLVCGRNEIDGENEYGKLIRFGLRSYFNHNGMTAKHELRGAMGINEAVEPKSKWTSLKDYEDLINRGYKVRFYRLKTASDSQLQAMAHYFTRNLLGMPYPKKAKMILLASRIINRLDFIPYKMHLTWCSQLVKMSFLHILHDCLDGPNNKKKNLFTPKTFENRILQGLFEDVTDDIVKAVK